MAYHIASAELASITDAEMAFSTTRLLPETTLSASAAMQMRTEPETTERHPRGPTPERKKQMELFVLIGQRRESYPGEYAPEALAVIDEVGDSDNPDYMRDELKKAKDSNDFENAIVVKITVSGRDVMSLLRPPMARLSGSLSAA